jgi:hypothetical protein
LAGRVIDARGTPMTTSFSYGRGDKCYRYYVSADAAPSSKAARPVSSISRVPAAGLEKLVLGAVGQALGATIPLAWKDALALVRAVEVRDRSVQLVLNATSIAEPHEPAEWLARRLQHRLNNGRVVAETDGAIRLILDRAPKLRGGSHAGVGQEEGGRPDPLTALWRSAHDLLLRHSMSPSKEEDHPAAEAPKEQRQRRLMALGFMAPSLQKRLAIGAFNPNFATKLLLQQMPLAWQDQEALFGA